ncbi:heme-binding protein 2 [Penaeus vannamei]|uniref:heme-binding protein 2 n=1 Tax=Penaeus vannamei TaxID=6689 RepID=UPI000F67246D|nr:heme-binding protein 2-like isoform X1 [Penaeus vannamei]XP_027221730.1 heme-binding protein 2-like isoform X2 [Penaeus vannamei]
MKAFVAIVFLQVCQLGLGIEMPPYNVTSSADSYEERVYPARKWVSTFQSGSDSGLFNRLFNYIDGQNEAGIKVDMTAPVTTLFVPCQDLRCATNYTMSFYVPAAHQDSPPTPTSADVYIEDRPQLHVFSRRFHGFASHQDYLSNAAQLHDDLVAAGEEGVDFETFYAVGYDSPFVIVGRNNEVWFVKK